MNIASNMFTSDRIHAINSNKHSNFRQCSVDNCCKLGPVFVLLVMSVFPALADDTTTDIPTVPDLENRLEAVRNDSTLSDSQRTHDTEALRVAIAQMQEAVEKQQQSVKYAELLASGGRRQAALEVQAADFAPSELPRDITEESLPELEALLTKYNLELVTQRNRFVQIDADIKNEKSFDIQAALETAKQAVQPVGERPADAKAGEVSDSTLAAVTRHLQTVNIENLEKRLLSRNVRLSLWELEQKLLAKQIAAAEARIVKLQAIVTDHRQSDANRTVSRARQTAALLSEEPQAIRDQAQNNIELADELASLVAKQDRIVREIRRTAQLALMLTQKFTSLTKQLEIVQLARSPEFGTALRKQRDELTYTDIAGQSLSRQEQAMIVGRLAQFRIDELREADARKDPLSIPGALLPGSEFAADPEREKIIKELLDTRESILNKLSISYFGYTNDLASLIAQNRALIRQDGQYTDLLDQQLLWMPSSDRIGAATLASFRHSLAWVVNPSAWQGFVDVVIGNMEDYPLPALAIALILGLLLLRRPRLISMLSSMEGQVGNVNRDKMSLTLFAALLTVLLALPGSLAMLLIASLATWSTSFSGAITDALIYGSMLYLVLEFVFQSTRQYGLLRLHFKWNPVTVDAMKKNLPWFIAVILPATVLTLIIEAKGGAVVRDSLGRMVFVVQTLAMAVFAYLVLPGARAVLQNRHQSSSDMLEWVIRNIQFSMVTLVPLSLVAMSIYGYHYTAVQLEAYLLNSALVILTGSFLYCLSQRAFAVNQRRLALESIRAERAAAVAIRSEASDEAEVESGIPTAVDLQKIDLQTIDKRTKASLKLVFAVTVGLALWSVWSGIIPAFEPLKNIVLWDIVEFVDGVQTSVPITLWNLMQASTTIIITFFAAKNISGVLESTFLGQFALKPGTSYAVTSVAQYVIAITGSVIALQMLGAQWSKLQWLVAALSVGLGFGLQEIVANFVSGIVILFERPIRIGDTVTVGNQWGVVSKISMRATTIVDFDRREIIVPNKAFIQERLTNWTLTDPINRRKITVGVAYGSDVSLVEKLLLDVAIANAKVLDEPRPEAFFLGFGDSSLNFELRIFVHGHRENARVIHEIHRAIDGEFRANGVEIAFPQRDLHLDPKPIDVRVIDAGEVSAEIPSA